MTQLSLPLNQPHPPQPCAAPYEPPQDEWQPGWFWDGHTTRPVENVRTGGWV